MKKAIIYCRTATSDQSKTKIDLQKEMCLQYARDRQLKVVGSVTETESGVELMRKGLLKLLFDCRTNGVEVVVAYDATRISRDFGQYEAIKDMLSVLNVQLLLVNDYEKEMTKEFSEIFKRYTSRMMSERIKRGIRFAKLKKLNS